MLKKVPLLHKRIVEQPKKVNAALESLCSWVSREGRSPESHAKAENCMYHLMWWLYKKQHERGPAEEELAMLKNMLLLDKRIVEQPKQS